MRSDSTYVLAVDDDPDIQVIISLALKLDEAIHVVVAGTGIEALSRLSEGPPPDLVLIDDKLSDMDGVSLLSAMRETGHGDFRFAFLTASVREADCARFTAAGAIGIIPKPFDPLTLAPEIRAMLAANPGPIDKGLPSD